MPDVVHPEEIEYFVKSLRAHQLIEVGSDKWITCHEMVIKLSQQAALEASSHREEVVKEHLILHSKLKVLIHEAFCILLWKTKVLPNLLAIDPNPRATFLTYTVLFHEGAVVALLEVCLFHQNGCESLEDSAVDLVDYCAQGVAQVIGLVGMGHHENFSKIDVDESIRCESLEDSAVDLVDYCAQGVAQVIGLVGMGHHENFSKIDVDESILTELERQKRDLIYKIGMRCISILNYLVDKVDVLSISAGRRLMTTHDVPYLVCDLLHFRPWLRRTSKGFEKFIGEKWTPVNGEKLAEVNTYEAQAWFCLMQMLSNQKLMASYLINEPRQQQLAKVQGLLNETLLDQLPILCELKKFLCSLTMSGTSNAKPKPDLLLEEVPEIKDKIIKEAEKRGGYFQIAQDQADLFLANDTERIVKIAKRLNVAYNAEMLAEVEEGLKAKEDVKGCGKCGKQAEKKCANCLKVAYCSRDCQVADWSSHKTQCLQTTT